MNPNDIKHLPWSGDPDASSDRFVRSHLKTRHLVILVELGRHGSVKHAAEAANVTQPAASKLLSELERSLGVQLFERLPRGVAPTEYGRVLMRRAAAALAEMKAAHQEVLQLKTGMRGRVSVGTILTPSATLVPAAVKLLKARHGGLHVAVAVDTSQALIERLLLGEYDIVIGRIRDVELAADLDFMPHMDEPHGIVAGPSHPLAGRKGLCLEQVARLDWVLPPADSLITERLRSMFMSHGVAPPAGTVTSGNFDVTLGLLANTQLVAPLPLELVRTDIGNGRLHLLDVDFDLRMDAYGIITRRHHRLSPGAEAMYGALCESMKAGARKTPRPLPDAGAA